MELVAKLDDLGKPAWIAAMVLGFIVFWPIGLGILAYLIWSGRMGCNKRGYGGWRNEAMRFSGRYGGGRSSGQGRRSSGNHAFDEYREETLQRLEEEQKQFSDYLDKLRMAKDKSEFEQFMADRRNAPSVPDTGAGTIPGTGTGSGDVTPGGPVPRV